jgi:hypothetical protein
LHGDVSDWLETGGAAEELQGLIAELPKASEETDVKPALERNRDRFWSMLPGELIESGLDDSCLRLYAELDLIQGQYGRPGQGEQYIADRLGWQKRTVARHAGHLDAAKLVKIEKPRGALGQRTYRLVHNIARGRISADAVIPERKRVARSSSAFERGRGAQDAPQVERGVQDAPGGCVTRTTSVSERGARNAPQSRYLGVSRKGLREDLSLSGGRAEVDSFETGCPVCGIGEVCECAL